MATQSKVTGLPLEVTLLVKRFGDLTARGRREPDCVRRASAWGCWGRTERARAR